MCRLCQNRISKRETLRRCRRKRNVYWRVLIGHNCLVRSHRCCRWLQPNNGGLPAYSRTVLESTTIRTTTNSGLGFRPQEVCRLRIQRVAIERGGGRAGLVFHPAEQ